MQSEFSTNRFRVTLDDNDQLAGSKVSTMAVRESQSVSSMFVGMGKRAARNFLRKILRIRGHETLRQNAYKAPSRYFRGLMRLLSAMPASSDGFVSVWSAKDVGNAFH